MWDRRSFLLGCAGLPLIGVAHSEALPLFGKDISDLTPEQVATNEDYWFGIQQAFTEDRNIINLNNGTIQNGLRIVQDAVRRHNEFSGNAAAHSMLILGKEIESCRRRLGTHLGCDPEELVICRGG